MRLELDAPCHYFPENFFTLFQIKGYHNAFAKMKFHIESFKEQHSLRKYK